MSLVSGEKSYYLESRVTKKNLKVICSKTDKIRRVFIQSFNRDILINCIRSVKTVEELGLFIKSNSVIILLQTNIIL